MFNIFKQIKQLKMTKQELETEREQLMEALDRANSANREQSALISQLRDDLNGAISRVRILDEQLNMREARQKATEQFNDNDKNY
jgi:chromosome segregation ATPase